VGWPGALAKEVHAPGPRSSFLEWFNRDTREGHDFQPCRNKRNTNAASAAEVGS